MQYKPTTSKILSLLVAVAMIFTMMPITAFAGDEPTLGDSGKIVIAALDALDETTLYQGYDAGTVTLDDLDLPDTLTGTDADENPLTIDGVTWQSAPGFDPAKEVAYPGYIFTPTLPEGYALAEGVTAPVITVFIQPAGGVGIVATAADTVSVGSQAATNPGFADHNGTNWTWTHSTNTLTLNAAGSPFGPIKITCGASTSVIIVVNGDVTVANSSGNAILCSADALNITNGGSGVLTATATGNGIYSLGNLTIGVPTTVTSSSGDGINVAYGSLTISANTTATGDSNGISANNGTTVSNGTVMVNGNIAGDLTVSGGDVTVNGTVSGSVIGMANVAPTATNVSTNGTAPVVGTQLTGTYTYNAGTGTGVSGSDASTFKWYRSTASTWGGATPEDTGATAKTYTPTGADVGKYLYFEVIPSNGTLTGSATRSTASGQVGIMVSLDVVANGTSGTATIGGGTAAVRVTSTTSPVVAATLNNAQSVAWTATAGTFTNTAATSPGYSLPTMNASVTAPITIMATFTQLPALGGTASITGTSKIGETLTAQTDSITGGSGAFSYQWKSGSANVGTGAATYTLVSSDVGKAITCVITRADATGSVTATFDSGAVVPYTIAVSNSGNVTGDTSVSASPDTGRVGISITLSYVLGNGGGTANNSLTFTGVTGLTNLTAPGSGPQNYTVKAADAVNGVITIAATFLHTNLTPRTLSFSDPGPVTKSLASGSFTNAATPGAGGGTIAYSSSVPGVATVDSNGTVTLVAAGQTTITATIAADATHAAATASYILTVNAAATSHTVTFNLNGGTRTGGGVLTQSVPHGTSATAPTVTRSGYTFTGWDKSFANVTADLTVTAQWSYNGGGGGGGGTTSTTIAPTTTWLEQTPAATLATGAKNRGENYVRTRSTGEYSVRGNVWAKFAGLQYQHDTVADGAVQVRLYINDPAKLTKDTLVSGSVKGSEVDRIKAFFEKWFKNKVRAIHFDQQGDFGQPVQIAAKVDLTGMDTENLYFYAYDKATNTYKRIEKPAYWIDANGYLHFTTEYAGDIIVSEGALEKR